MCSAGEAEAAEASQACPRRSLPVATPSAGTGAGPSTDGATQADRGRRAAAVGVGLLRRRADGEFREDERETALRALGRIALRGTLDVTADLTKHLREDVVEELLAGIADTVPGAYEALARMRTRENLPEKLREDISKKLAAYESLVLA